ncbi:MAG: hypothetical protein M3R04_01170 [bacterium]|nr:hypothetical protein [bacterium]
MVRTSLLCGLLVALAYVALSLPGVNSNVDFTYMSVGAALLSDGQLPATPYFPPGYPALLWLLLQSGATALTAGALLSALGIGMLSGAITYVARLWNIPPAPALMLGLLAATMPSMLLVGVNPHLDALYAGLGAVLLACAMRAFSKPPSAWVYFGALLCAALMLSLRYHAALVIVPLALVLTFSRAKGVRTLGVTVLLLGVAAIAASLSALHSVTGSTRTAALDQVRTGSAYRELKSEAAMSAEVYDDYAGWLKRWPQANGGMVVEGIIANWPNYLTRKSIIAGAALWLFAWLIRRRETPGAIWLLLFIAGYTLAISPTYYITRASVLPEAAGIMLGVAGISALLFPSEAKALRRKQIRIDPMLAGAAVCLLAVAGLGYNVWREVPIMQLHYAHARLYREVNAEALKLVGGSRRYLYGVVHSTGIYGSGKFNLPGTTWSRLWMDDPAVAPLVDPYLPKQGYKEVLAGKSNATAIVIWRTDVSRPSIELESALRRSEVWEEVDLKTDQARLWRRRMSGVREQDAVKGDEAEESETHRAQ